MLLPTDPAQDKKKINYMEDIVLLSMLNRQYDNHVSEEENGPGRSSLEEHPGLQQFFKTDGSTVPVFFKAVSIDEQKFFILLINYNKSQTVGDWSNVWEALATQQGGLNKIVVGSYEKRLSEVFAISLSSTDQIVYRLGRIGTATDWNQFWIPLASQVKIKQVVVGRQQKWQFCSFCN